MEPLRLNNNKLVCYASVETGCVEIKESNRLVARFTLNPGENFQREICGQIITIARTEERQFEIIAA